MAETQAQAVCHHKLWGTLWAVIRWNVASMSACRATVSQPAANSASRAVRLQYAPCSAALLLLVVAGFAGRVHRQQTGRNTVFKRCSLRSNASNRYVLHRTCCGTPFLRPRRASRGVSGPRHGLGAAPMLCPVNLYWSRALVADCLADKCTGTEAAPAQAREQRRSRISLSPDVEEQPHCVAPAGSWLCQACS